MTARSKMSDAEAASASFFARCKTAGAAASLLREEGISCDLEGSADARWNAAVLDSRRCGPGNFFVALQGKNHNGGDYAASAFAQGATVALIERAYKTDARIRAAVDPSSYAASSAAAAVFVDDARDALKALARRVRTQAKAAVIAVTGSAGKTTTKEMLRAMLGAVGNEGNYNTEEGLSVSLLNAPWNEDTRFGVFECGISEPGEMRRLVDILRPDCALITNVGSAHAGYFSSKQALADEKLSVACLLPPEATAWVPEEDEALFARAQELLSCTVRTHGPKSCKGLARIEDCGARGSRLHFADAAVGGPAVISLRAIGAVNARNAVAALCVADFFDVPRDRSAQALEQFLGVGRRYEVLCEEPLVIDDSYNASTHSVSEALRWFAQHVPAPRIAVLGGMKELGAYSAQEHQAVVNAAAELFAEELSSDDEARQTLVLLVGEEYRGVRIAPQHAHLFRHVEDAACADAALQSAEEELGAGRAACSVALFVKGSNAYNLSELARSAARRRGETRAYAVAGAVSAAQ